MQSRRHRIWLWSLGSIAALAVLLVLLWDWNWFKPLVEAQASGAIGRKVTIGNFDVKLSLHPQIVLDKIAVANPEDFPADSKMATVDHLAVRVNPWKWFDHRLDLMSIEIDKPVGDLKPGSSGKANWQIASKPQAAPKSPTQPPEIDIDSLVIRDGNIHFLDPRFKSDFTITVHTEAKDNGGEPSIVVTADGTYSAQPITAKFVGGSVLRLRNPANPYPVDLHIAHGATKVSLKGTLLDPMKFAGANLTLDLQGDDLASLYPLTGIPLAPTPPYRLTGELDYADQKIRFENFQGTVGQSDLSGGIEVDPGRERPMVTANMSSKKVVLADLAGFIGAPPGKEDAPTEGKKQEAEHAQKDANPKLLPTTPINLPKLRSADLDVQYKATRIESENTPLDDIVAHLKVDNGALSLKPLAFGVGTGKIVLNVVLDGQEDLVHAVADIDVRQIELSRIMKKSTAFNGSGTIGGSASIDTTGNSLSTMLGRGNGDLKLFMTGGDISALLLDLAGLDLGNSILSAVGIPSRAQLRCLVADYGLKQGLLDTHMLLVDTTEANVTGKGTVNLADETIDYRLETDPKHFNIGSLAAPINIKGTLKSPSILPDMTVLGVRAAAATALGVLATPLAALIPTIQLGLGKDNDCNALLSDLSPKAKAAVEKKTGTKPPAKPARKTKAAATN